VDSCLTKTTDFLPFSFDPFDRHFSYFCVNLAAATRALNLSISLILRFLRIASILNPVASQKFSNSVRLILTNISGVTCLSVVDGKLCEGIRRGNHHCSLAECLDSNDSILFLLIQSGLPLSRWRINLKPSSNSFSRASSSLIRRLRLLIVSPGGLGATWACCRAKAASFSDRACLRGI
jgi:hypothetical protein